MQINKNKTPGLNSKRNFDSFHSSFVYFDTIPDFNRTLFAKQRVFWEERLVGNGEAPEPITTVKTTLEEKESAKKYSEIESEDQTKVTQADITQAENWFKTMFNNLNDPKNELAAHRDHVHSELLRYRRAVRGAEDHTTISTVLHTFLKSKIAAIENVAKQNGTQIGVRTTAQTGEVRFRLDPNRGTNNETLTRQNEAFINAEKGLMTTALTQVLSADAVTSMKLEALFTPPNEIIIRFMRDVHAHHNGDYRAMFQNQTRVNQLITAMNNLVPPAAENTTEERALIKEYLTQVNITALGVTNSLDAAAKANLVYIIAARFNVTPGTPPNTLVWKVRRGANYEPVDSANLANTIKQELHFLHVTNAESITKVKTQIDTINGGFRAELLNLRAQNERNALLPEQRDREAVFDALGTVIGMRQDINFRAFTQALPANQRQTMETLMNSYVSGAVRSRRVERTVANGPLNQVKLVNYVREGFDRDAVQSVITMLENLNREIQLAKEMVGQHRNFKALLKAALPRINNGLSGVTDEHLAVFLALNYDITKRGSRYMIGAGNQNPVAIPADTNANNIAAFKTIIQSAERVTDATSAEQLRELITQASTQNINLAQLRTNLNEYKNRAPQAQGRWGLGKILQILIALITKKSETIPAIIRGRTEQQDRTERRQYFQEQIRKQLGESATNIQLITHYNTPSTIATQLANLTYPPSSETQRGAQQQQPQTAQQRRTAQVDFGAALMNVFSGMGGGGSMIENGRLVIPGQSVNDRQQVADVIKTAAAQRIAENLVSKNQLNTPELLWTELSKGQGAVTAALNTPAGKAALVNLLSSEGTPIQIGTITYDASSQSLLISLGTNRFVKIKNNQVLVTSSEHIYETIDTSNAENWSTVKSEIAPAKFKKYERDRRTAARRTAASPS